MDILQKIVEKTRQRVAQLKTKTSLQDICLLAEEKMYTATERPTPFAFEQVLAHKDISFICEVKKASPSKGVIAVDFPYIDIAKEYEEAGAAAISVLTEPSFFMGADNYLTEIARAVRIPILRKDFTIDAYQIYEAKVLNAHAVLLICAILDASQLQEYMAIADSLGLSCLVEAHSAEEVAMAVNAKARVIGVNNRNLKTFTVDIQTSLQLRSCVPQETLFVSESGIKSAKDITALRNHAVNAVLIGETFMRAPNKKHVLQTLRGITVC